MSYKSVTVEIADYIAEVTLIGPGKGNAMGPDFWSEMPRVFAELDANPEVRAVVLTGSGKNFSYGLDLTAMGGGALAPVFTGEMTARDRLVLQDEIRAMQTAITAVAECRKPVVAAIAGWCIGGGVDLITAADIRYASADAKFSVREVKVAIVADMGTLARLPQVVGDGHTRELALTGKDIDAARAEKIGLVNDVFDDQDALLAAAKATARDIADQSPLAMAGVKEVLNFSRRSAEDESLKFVAVWNAAFLASRDLLAAVTAAMTKQKPTYTGE